MVLASAPAPRDRPDSDPKMEDHSPGTTRCCPKALRISLRFPIDGDAWRRCRSLRRNSRPVGAPRVGRQMVLVLDPYRHLAQAVEQPDFTANRPPVVKEDLERAPHCHPTTDHEPFS